MPLQRLLARVCYASLNTINDCAAQSWFKKFSSGNETLEDESIINDKKLEAL